MTTTGQGYAIATAYDLGVSTFWFHEGYEFTLDGAEETLQINDRTSGSDPICYSVESVNCENGRLTIATDGFYVVLSLDKEALH